MKIAEIERDLRNESPKLRYHVAHIQEQLTALQTQQRMFAELLVKVVDSLNQLRLVNLKLNERWERRLRGESDVEIVSSVLPDPNERD